MDSTSTKQFDHRECSAYSPPGQLYKASASRYATVSTLVTKYKKSSQRQTRLQWIQRGARNDAPNMGRWIQLMTSKLIRELLAAALSQRVGTYVNTVTHRTKAYHSELQRSCPSSGSTSVPSFHPITVRSFQLLAAIVALS